MTKINKSLKPIESIKQEIERRLKPIPLENDKEKLERMGVIKRD